MGVGMSNDTHEDCNNIAAPPNGRNNTYASFLIKKHGAFYRPYWSGYTNSELAAGRYTYAQAKAEVAIEPTNISMHTAPECKPQGVAAAILRLLDL